MTVYHIGQSAAKNAEKDLKEIKIHFCKQTAADAIIVQSEAAIAVFIIFEIEGLSKGENFIPSGPNSLSLLVI